MNVPYLFKYRFFKRRSSAHDGARSFNGAMLLRAWKMMIRITMHPNQPELQRSHALANMEKSCCSHPNSHSNEKSQSSSQDGSGVNCHSLFMKGFIFSKKNLNNSLFSATHAPTKQPLEIQGLHIGKRGREVECSRLLIGQTVQGHEGSNPSASASSEKDIHFSPKGKAN